MKPTVTTIAKNYLILRMSCSADHAAVRVVLETKRILQMYKLKKNHFNHFLAVFSLKTKQFFSQMRKVKR